MARARKSADERKSEIVDVALRLAGDLGPDRLTTDAVAKAIGISQPAIFRHFPTKAAIWRAVAERIDGRLRESAATPRDSNRQPGDKIRNFVAGHLGFLEKTPAISAILFSRELHAENETLRAFFAGMIKRRHGHLSGLVAAEIKAGAFRASLDPDDAAYLVLAVMQGLAMRWSLNAREFSLVDEGHRLLELVLDGFLTESREAT